MGSQENRFNGDFRFIASSARYFCIIGHLSGCNPALCRRRWNGARIRTVSSNHDEISRRKIRHGSRAHKLSIRHWSLFGLFGWILLASATGWRSTLVLSAGLGLLTGLLVIALVPKDEKNLQFRFFTNKLVKILTDRNLIVLGLGSLGSNLGSVLISSFMAYYLQASLGETAAIAGIVAAMIVVLPIYTSLWGGRHYDRSRRPRRLLVFSGMGMTAAMLVNAVPTLPAAAAGAVLGGIAVGPASTINFAAAKDLSRVEREYEGLTIGWVNSISLTGSFWPPLVFSYFARSFNYSAAWIAGAAMCFLLLVPLFFLREDPSRFAKVT